MAKLHRLRSELEMLTTEPGPGVSCWVVDESDMTNLEAQIQGPEDSPYAQGTFRLSIQIPDRYPFEPPRVRFMTPIYHPNIDPDGRICLDTLKMQPHGSWSPSININTLLLTIRVLMGSPNASDGLVPEITEEYKRDISLWRKKAIESTLLNASSSSSSSAAAAAASAAVSVSATRGSSVDGKAVDASNSGSSSGGGGSRSSGATAAGAADSEEEEESEYEEVDEDEEDEEDEEDVGQGSCSNNKVKAEGGGVGSELPVSKKPRAS